jgi:hypothetical protein
MLSILLKIASASTYKSPQKKNMDEINKFNSKVTAAIATVTLSFTLFSSNPAKAASFTFSQGDWQYGGNLSGSFTGDDLNGDGKIDTSELSAFNAIFFGNLRADINNPFTGEPIIVSSTISHSLPPLGDNTVEDLSFNYFSSTLQLSFSSFRGSCTVVAPSPIGCLGLNGFSIINTSATGGTVVNESVLRFSSSSLAFRTSSSSAPIVTPLQQPIPEPSTLGGTLLGGLGFLLRRKVTSSRTTTETTKVATKVRS